MVHGAEAVTEESTAAVDDAGAPSRTNISAKPDITGEDVLAGDAIDKVLDYCVREFSKHSASKSNLSSAPVLLYTASACSGSGIDELIRASLAVALERHGFNIKFQDKFFCEIDKRKQAWLLDLCLMTGSHKHAFLPTSTR